MRREVLSAGKHREDPNMAVNLIRPGFVHSKVTSKLSDSRRLEIVSKST